MCVCIYMYIYIYVCVYICVLITCYSINLCLHTHIYMYICIYSYEIAHTSICILSQLSSLTNSKDLLYTLQPIPELSSPETEDNIMKTYVCRCVCMCRCVDVFVCVDV